MEEFSKGIYISIVGMGLVFLSLGLIMVLIWGMERVFREKEEKEAPAPEAEARELTAVTQLEPAVDGEVAAAIAVALLVVQQAAEQSERSKLVGAAAGNGGATMWTAMGRQIHMNSRYVIRESKSQ